MVEERLAADTSSGRSSVDGDYDALCRQVDSIRIRLERVFKRLHLVLAVCITVHKAMLQQHADQDETFALVLQRCGHDDLHEQLEQLAAIVEEIGGTCDYTGEQPPMDQTGTSG